MKFNTWMLLIAFSFSSSNLLADEAELKIVTPKKKKEASKTLKTTATKKSVSVNTSLDRALSNLNLQGQKIENLLGKFQERSGVWDFTNQYDFKTGTIIKGILLNSVISTNLESPLIVEVTDGEALPIGTRFICRGVTKFKRVLSVCHKLITPNDEEEFEIRANLLNMDGSSGLKADEVYSGKEEYMGASIATAFSRGLIELGTERLSSPYGELTINNRKNRITNGVLNSLDETNELMNSEMKSKEPKAVIYAGKPVLIYFQERFTK